MGLFDLFGSREERQRGALKKLAKRVTERYGPPENRQKAIQQLGDLGTPGALSTLCLRFTVRAEPGITDDEEKETALRILVDAKEAAVGPLEAFVREQESGVAWGLRALADIVPSDRLVEIVVRELARLGREYTRDPEKKLVLLTWLVEHHAGATGPEIEGALLPLLEDFSDDVRISAARAIARLAPGEAGRDALIQLLLRDRDNARVRGEVLEALAHLGADVKGHRPSVEALLVEPFFLDREGRVKKRG
ncbi:HEAT repeat domain-containing protein [Anaeromyxobacter terrae]|uniref:HEAT repeat domain-containing protein n=1 Tax=Anaeromyxobacter terrae TaxID=2925406 RepID=UPI001F58EACA|nr:HEAT repeat domain-containing protein [Anaeromyxobacter sp. SG22]